MTRKAQLRRVQRALEQAYGRQRWWPARTQFEVILGAYLTQNTSWKNVERAVGNLRSAGKLSLGGVRGLRLQELEKLVRPSGYFRQKAARLKRFVEFLDARYDGSLTRMFGRARTSHAAMMGLRQELLELNGVGPETADSILLYAGGLPVFVVDAYTRRVLDRHGILPYSAPYEAVRRLFEQTFRGRNPAQTFNELHALYVSVGKTHCGRQAECDGCPLQPFLSPKQRARLASTPSAAKRQSA